MEEHVNGISAQRYLDLIEKERILNEARLRKAVGYYDGTNFAHIFYLGSGELMDKRYAEANAALTSRLAQIEGKLTFRWQGLTVFNAWRYVKQIKELCKSVKA